jgi:hypothetical protein
LCVCVWNCNPGPSFILLACPPAAFEPRTQGRRLPPRCLALRSSSSRLLSRKRSIFFGWWLASRCFRNHTRSFPRSFSSAGYRFSQNFSSGGHFSSGYCPLGTDSPSLLGLWGILVCEWYASLMEEMQWEEEASHLFCSAEVAWHSLHCAWPAGKATAA